MSTQDLISVHRNGGVEIFSVENKSNEEIELISKKFIERGEDCMWSPDGSKLGLRTMGSDYPKLAVYDLDKGFDGFQVVPSELHVRKFSWSPKGSFLCIIGVQPENKDTIVIEIWDMYFQKKVALTTTSQDVTGPVFKWSSNETYMIHREKKRVTMYKENFDNPIPLTPQNVTNFSIATEASSSVRLALFIRGTSTIQSQILIFNTKKLDHPTVKVDVGHVESASLHWSASSSAMVAMVSAEVDPAGGYYGETQIRFFGPTGVNFPIGSEIEGNVHAFEWNPKADEFIVIKGQMPPSIDVYSGKNGNHLRSFGRNSRNQLFFNAFGTSFACCGLGNLPGYIETLHPNTQEKYGFVQAPWTVTLEYSPDSSLLLLSTTTPRLREDNKIRIMNPHCKIIFEMKFQTLYLAAWRPRLNAVDKSINFPTQPIQGTGSDQYNRNVYRAPGTTASLSSRLNAEAMFNSKFTSHKKNAPKQVVPGLIDTSQGNKPNRRKNKHKGGD